MSFCESILIQFTACYTVYCVPSGFGGRAGYEMSISHVFPQVLLEAITLVGDGARGVGGGEGRNARARGRCKPGLLLFSVASTAFPEMEIGSMLMEQKLEGSHLSLLHSL